MNPNVVFLVVAALVLTALFTFLWLWDARRSEQQAHDTDRQDVATTPGRPSWRRRRAR